MLNQIVLVGRLTSDPIINEVEDKKVMELVVSVPRSFKNSDGEYETDYITIIIYNGIASSVYDYCHKGDIIGVKGRIESKLIEDGENQKYENRIIAEKVTFLSSKKSDSEE